MKSVGSPKESSRAEPDSTKELAKLARAEHSIISSVQSERVVFFFPEQTASGVSPSPSTGVPSVHRSVQLFVRRASVPRRRLLYVHSLSPSRLLLLRVAPMTRRSSDAASFGRSKRGHVGKGGGFCHGREDKTVISIST
ncbi:unnamed protein product [Victoria cruziana]